MKMEFLPVRTRVVRPPKDEIWDIIDGLEVRDGDIIFITSKIMGIHQGRTVKVGEVPKEELIRRESEYWFPYDNPGGFHVNLTITDNVLIPAAGIDESNADGHYIMWPKDIDGFCRGIRERIIDRTGVSRLGVVATDSHTTPLRWGVTGITIGLSGIRPLRDVRGEKDIFGREMHLTQIDVIDPLTSMAVLIMGETDARTPIVILRGWEGVVFDERADMVDFKIPPEEDLYQPMLEVIKKGKK